MCWNSLDCRTFNVDNIIQMSCVFWVYHQLWSTFRQNEARLEDGSRLGLGSAGSISGQQPFERDFVLLCGSGTRRTPQEIQRVCCHDSLGRGNLLFFNVTGRLELLFLQVYNPISASASRCILNQFCLEHISWSDWIRGLLHPYSYGDLERNEEK